MIQGLQERTSRTGRQENSLEHKSLTYKVIRLRSGLALDAEWDKEPWAGIAPLLIADHMGPRPAHMPKTQAKIAYDDESICVIFRVEDRYVGAVAENHQDSVYADSCVEFFFTPGPDIGRGYFNLEMNCGGRILLGFHPAAGQGNTRLFSLDECDLIPAAHSMPQIVDPEIQEPTTWTVEYQIPLDLPGKYCEVDRPAPGVVWRANLYKCADASSHPHWLTWSHVDFPRPDFHRPQSFGTLRFA